MRVSGGRLIHVPGWTGGVIEDAEPDRAGDTRRGVLDDGLNLSAKPGGRLAVRGGSQVVRSFAAVSGDAISDLFGPWRYSQTGMVVVGHSTAGSKHYAYLLAEDGSFALPAGSATESGSRIDMTWNSATPARPQAVELFEKLYIVDATIGSPQGMVVLSISGGSPALAKPVYDLDGSGSGTATIRGYAVATFAGVLFVAGYGDEVAGLESHLVRHSWLGRDPAASNGFDPDAQATIGAIDQRVTAMVPGNSVLLIAKENELYRISGTGAGIEGWQFGIAPLDNTLGMGASNPYAMAHAAGAWFGVGRSGPWRSDGQRVEPLVAGRARSWALVSSLEKAVVTHDPDRRKMLFWFYRGGLSSYASAPFECWKWDLERDQWDVNERYARSFHMVAAVPQTGAVLVPDAPSDLVQSFDGGDFETTAAWVTWTAGSVTADTEVWASFDGGVSTLRETVPGGVQRARVVPGAGKTAAVKLRHRQGAVLSEFTAEETVYARLETPLITTTFTQPPSYGTRALRTVSAAGAQPGVDLIGTSAGATWSKTWLNATPPVTDSAVLDGASETYRCVAESAAWPVGYDQSIQCEHFTVGRVGNIGLMEPRQALTSALVGEEVVGVVFQTEGNAAADIEHRLEYRVWGSGGAWTDSGQSFTYHAADAWWLQPLSLVWQVLSLAASGKYEVRIRFGGGGSGHGPTVAMYTKLAAPTISAALTGVGTPGVDLTITVPVAGHDLHVYNADGSYDQTFTNVTAGAHVYTSTAGVCGRGDRYYVRTKNSGWPTGLQYSDAASVTITSPCT